MNTPCQDRIEMAVQARARSILRRWFATPTSCRPTAEEAQWLEHNLPKVSTDTSLERALWLAGPALSKACSYYVSEFYLPRGENRLRDFVLAALETEAPNA